jgi:hypothetical protein
VVIVSRSESSVKYKENGFNLRDFGLDTAGIWDSYNQHELETRGAGFGNNGPTALFFDNKITSNEKSKFDGLNKIIQFGAGIGSFYKGSRANDGKEIISYDFSTVAMQAISSKAVIERKVNLNDIDSQNPSALAYHDKLQHDLAEPCALLIIRTAEYLDASALTLLIFSLIDLAKPGSMFYFEILATGEVDEPCRNELPNGYVPSFFAPRTDINFRHRAITHNEVADACSGQTSIERFIVEKLAPGV